ncbi:MAG: LysR substrate-binding domain-containing protein [Myxococcota bacterium]
MRLTLRQIEVFLAAAHHENVTRAAESLSMSQSAASGALKELEQQFEIELFDRVGKRIQLNALGASVRPLAEALLSQAEALEAKLGSREAGGALRVGATLTIGNHVAIDLLARFAETSPETRVDLDIANTREIARRVTNFEVDVGLVEGEVHGADLEILPWHGDELVVCCPPDHPWARRSELEDPDLRRASWILREEGSGTRQTFDRAMQGLLPTLDIVHEFDQTEAILRAVRLGLGVSCLSRLVLEESLERGDLAAARIPHRDLTRSFYLIVHRQKYRSDAVQKWLESCRAWPPATTERRRTLAPRPRVSGAVGS